MSVSPEDFSKEPAAGVLRRIKENGPITFAEYMEAVLYGPRGYYTFAEGPWGEGGDYITSLDVSPVFARMLAKQAHEMWRVLGQPGEFRLIEAGAGRGWLTKSIIETAGARYPEFSRALSATLVERNTALRTHTEDGLSWCDDITQAGVAHAGCIVSNELIDSFPVHRVVMRAGSLKEVYVGSDGAGLIDVAGEPSTPELEAYLASAGVDLSEGQLAEVNLAACGWIESAAAVLERGFVITIDYGLPARELYAPERLAGTLLCHYRHTLNDDPYVNIGRQDITTHVDFSTLARRGAAVGLELTGFATQKDFLLGLGICEELEEAPSGGLEDFERISANRALARLIAPGGMGDTFKVLIQHKGVERPSLAGLSFKDRARLL